MNFENKGIPIAVLKSKIKKRDDVILHYDENSRGRFPDEIDLRNLAGGSSSSFQVLPSQNERDVLYVCGKSGSGKSYHIKNYCMEYHKEHPKNPIWLISPKQEDVSFKEIKKIMTQLRLDDEFINTEIGLDDLANSMIIFDDAEGLGDKKLREKVFKLLNLCMTCGRSYKISVAVISHCPTNAKETRIMLLENSHCSFFPSFLSDHSLNYLCKNYLGLGKAHINKILKTNDRSCCVLNNPRVVITDKVAFAVKR
jgi:ribosomal protein L15